MKQIGEFNTKVKQSHYRPVMGLDKN